MQVLQVLTVLFVAIAMGLALAHAAELPGKRRLDEATYRAVQSIYYPGFTIGGGAEPGSIMLLIVLLSLTGPDAAAFFWMLAALLALVTMQLIYWLVTHPVNSTWLKDRPLRGLGAVFFSLGARRGEPTGPQADWTRLRDVWEYSHVARAAVGLLALVLLLVAVTS
jgi:hypothetical protein